MQISTPLYSDIFKYIRTREQAKEFYEGVEAISDLSFVIDNGNVNVLKKTFPIDIAEAIYQIVHISNINEKDPMHLKQFLLGLKEEVEKAKIADVTLGIVPDHEFIINLSNSLREALNDKTLVMSLKTDATIIGGIELIWSGRYWNLSLEKQIDLWFANKSTSNNKEQMTSAHSL